MFMHVNIYNKITLQYVSYIHLYVNVHKYSCSTYVKYIHTDIRTNTNNYLFKGRAAKFDENTKARAEKRSMVMT